MIMLDQKKGFFSTRVVNRFLFIQPFRIVYEVTAGPRLPSYAAGGGRGGREKKDDEGNTLIV